MTEKKVWLITGARRGLGVDIAKSALAAGHSVVATGRNAARVADAVGEHDKLLLLAQAQVHRELSTSLGYDNADHKK